MFCQYVVNILPNSKHYTTFLPIKIQLQSTEKNKLRMYIRWRNNSEIIQYYQTIKSSSLAWLNFGFHIDFLKSTFHEINNKKSSRQIP